MKLLTTLLLSFVLIFSTVSPALAQDHFSLDVSQAQVAPTDLDYWSNSIYAMGGSAAGNGLILLTVLALDLAPLVFTNEGEVPADWVGSAGVWLFLLGVIPVISTTLLMHVSSPKADWESVFWTGLGSLLSVLVHSLVVVLPMSLIFQQGSPTETFYLVAPVALLTGVIFEGLTAAQFHQFSERWRVSQTPGGGIMLSHQIDF